jgi:hypothetical protein
MGCVGALLDREWTRIHANNGALPRLRGRWGHMGAARFAVEQLKRAPTLSRVALCLTRPINIPD